MDKKSDNVGAELGENKNVYFCKTGCYLGKEIWRNLWQVSKILFIGGAQYETQSFVYARHDDTVGPPLWLHAGLYRR